VKKLFYLLFFSVSVYAQVGVITICEGIRNNEFVNEDISILTHNDFVWYFMRYDFKPVGFTDFTLRVINISTGITNDYKGGSDKNTPCPYFEDNLPVGKWYMIMLDKWGAILGKSKEFEVR